MKKIKNSDIIDLMTALAFEHEFYDGIQFKHRFSKDDWFVDVWNGKKRLTIGAYHPLSKKMSYGRCKTILELEKIVCDEIKYNEGT